MAEITAGFKKNWPAFVFGNIMGQPVAITTSEFDKTVK